MASIHSFSNLMQAHVIGIDLAWSPRNPTGIAIAAVTSTAVVVKSVTTTRSNGDILLFIEPFAAGPLVVAIDAPTVVPNESGMRPCERLLQKERLFQLTHTAPYAGNRTRLGACNGGVPRGEELVGLLRTLGVEEVGCPPSRSDGRFAIEVFPAPAQARLFNLTAPMPYKKKKGRSWEMCREGLSSYIKRLRALTAPSLEFSSDLAVADEKGKVGLIRFGGRFSYAA